MRLCSPVKVQLDGGPNDGECFLMSPCPGVGPPQYFAYYARRRPGEEDMRMIVDTYELWPPMPTWPDADGDEPVMVKAYWQPELRRIVNVDLESAKN